MVLLSLNSQHNMQGIFLHDGAPSHRAKKTKETLQNYQFTQNASYSLDLNPAAQS